LATPAPRRPKLHRDSRLATPPPYRRHKICGMYKSVHELIISMHPVPVSSAFFGSVISAHAPCLYSPYCPGVVPPRPVSLKETKGRLREAGFTEKRARRCIFGVALIPFGPSSHTACKVAGHLLEHNLPSFHQDMPGQARVRHIAHSDPFRTTMGRSPARFLW
jgi:hypothetical protein